MRSLWRSLEKSTETVELPSEQESLQQRVQRCLDEQENNSEIVPPTVTSSIRNVVSSSDLDKTDSNTSDVSTSHSRQLSDSRANLSTCSYADFHFSQKGLNGAPTTSEKLC